MASQPRTNDGASSVGVPCYWKGMWEKLNRMRQLWQLCDVTLFSKDDTMFKAHSSVLAASSDRFHSYFVYKDAQGIQDGKNQGEIKLPDISKDVLLVTLEFIYGNFPIDKTDLMKLKQGAESLEIQGAVEFLKHVMEKNEDSVQRCPILRFREFSSQALKPYDADSSVALDLRIWKQSRCPLRKTVIQGPAEMQDNYTESRPAEMQESYTDPRPTGMQDSYTDPRPAGMQDSYTDPRLQRGVQYRVNHLQKDWNTKQQDMNESNSAGYKELQRAGQLFFATHGGSNAASTQVTRLQASESCVSAAVNTSHTLPSHGTMPTNNMNATFVGRTQRCPVSGASINTGQCNTEGRNDLNIISSQVAIGQKCPVSNADSRVDISGVNRNNAWNKSAIIKTDFGQRHTDKGTLNSERYILDAKGNSSDFNGSAGLLGSQLSHTDSINTIAAGHRLGAQDSNNPITLQNSVVQREDTCPLGDSKQSGAYPQRCDTVSNSNSSVADSTFRCPYSGNDGMQVPEVTAAVHCETTSSKIGKCPLGFGELTHTSGTLGISGDRTKCPFGFKKGDMKGKLGIEGFGNSIDLSSEPNGVFTSHGGNELGLDTTESVIDIETVDKGESTESMDTPKCPFQYDCNDELVINNTDQGAPEKQPEAPVKFDLLSDASFSDLLSPHNEQSITTPVNQDPGIEINDTDCISQQTSARDRDKNSEITGKRSHCTQDQTSCKKAKFCSDGNVQLEIIDKTPIQREMIDKTPMIIQELECTNENISLGKKCESVSDKAVAVPNRDSGNVSDVHVDPKKNADSVSGMVKGVVIDIEEEKKNMEFLNTLKSGHGVKSIFRCYADGCSYENRQGDYMLSHMWRRHDIGKPSRMCPMCDHKYFSERQLKTHMKRSHGPQTDEPHSGEELACSQCSETFSSRSSLHIHQIRVHKKGVLFNCEDCKFKTPRKKDMQVHMLSQHNKVVPGVQVFSCQHCDYRCLDRNRHEEHEAKHTGLQRFLCPHCGKSYTTKRGMKTHLQYHSDQRPHQCDMCPANFKVRSKLKDHIRLVHTNKGEKPYKCGYCDHQTALRGNCNQHIRKYHQGKPVLVIDLKADQRRTVRPYNYAHYKGANIQLSQDVESASWASVGTGNQAGKKIGKSMKSCTVQNNPSSDASPHALDSKESRTLPNQTEKHSEIIDLPVLDSVSGKYALQIDGNSQGTVRETCVADADLFVVNR